ncbi:MAG: translocation/assembly module TamB domain-containing protein [Epsilonproteobacteria bacterium]|nr:translocation/assembly module TamB domain-containing protein [Campylobacterota bacterium]
MDIKHDNFRYKNKDFDILTNIDISVELDSNKTSISGELNLLGDKITYESVGGAGVQEDSDIIVIQDMALKAKNPMNDLKLMIKVKSQNPIKYETDSIKADIMSDFTIYKEYNKEMQILGQAVIKSGSYVVEDRYFSIENSNLYFTGNPKNPILDIRARYIKDKYNVRIYITGTPNEPIVHFNSDPYLSQEEALSLILFDTPTVDVGGGHGAYAVVGSALAKNLVKNIAGIKLDHFILSESSDETINIEFGQKISDNITVIYLHENAKDGVKTRIEHNENFETDIIIMPPNSSSIEFLYKKNR